MTLYLILHNIRSLHNIGSIFRTADAMGVEKIFLCGYTPTPYNFFEKLRKDFAKTALGAEQYVRWEKIQNIHSLIKKLKKEKVFVASLEQSKHSIQLDRLASKKKPPVVDIALILGNEVRGIPKSVLASSDAILEIPMRGKKESLNVSVATGIVLYVLKYTLEA